MRKKNDADALKAQLVSVTNTNVVTEKGSDLVSLSTPAANTGGRDAIAVRSSGASASSSALDLIKKKLQDSGIPDSSSPPAVSGSVASELNGSKPGEATAKSIQNDNHKDKNGDGDISNSSSDSEDEDRGPTKEECILQFKVLPLHTYNQTLFTFICGGKTPQNLSVIYTPKLLCCRIEVLISSINDLNMYLFASSSTFESNEFTHFTYTCFSEFLGDAQGKGSGTILKMG